ncbi:MAG: peptidylprolyl isomerase [Candidatus Margulisiibacteriota bacterium]
MSSSSKSHKLVIATLVACSVSLFILSGCSNKDTLAKVDGDTITTKDLDARIKTFPAQYASALQQRDNKVKVLNQMVDEKILAKAAEDEGITKQDEYQTQLESAKQNILTNLIVREKVEKNIPQVTEDDIRDYFTKNPAQFAPAEQRRVRHILVKTPEEANQILDSLRRGADFGAIAREKSLDPTGKNGGDLGWFSRGQLVPDFERVAFDLREKGQLSGVVQTQFGFHVIQLLDTGMRPGVSFAEAHDRIRDMLVNDRRKQTYDKFMTDLKTKYKVKVNADLVK